MSARLLLLTALSLAAPAFADGDWAASFPQAFLQEQMPPGARTFLIAATGQPVAEVKKAAQVLGLGIQGCRRVTMVMDDVALGDLSKASDVEVRERAAATPVAILVIVRLSVPAGGGAPTAVVTMFDNKQGSPRGGFTVTKGQPPAPPEPPPEPVKPPPPPPPPPKPVVVEEAPPPPPVVEVPKVEKPKPQEPTLPPEDPQVTYEQRSLHFADDLRNEGTRGDPTQVLMGRSTTPLKGGQFYSVIGRRDLAQSYNGRSTAKVLLGLGGVVVMAASAVASWWLISNPKCVRLHYSAPGAESDACLEAAWPDLTGPAMGVGGAGLVMVLWGLIMSPHPVDGSEARNLVDEYNMKLRRSLNLTSTNEVHSPPLTVAPVALPGGGGVSVSGGF